MPQNPRDLHAALVRARWSIIQTGLITTGLALFGVYVLANRINDVQVMNLYVLRGVPAGAWIVGTVAGAGYAIASWWNGMRVRGGLLLAVVLLQIAAYFCAHYVQFASIDFALRGLNVNFASYFHFVTMNLTQRELDAADRMPQWGYAMRAVEALIFCFGALSSAIVLSGQPACPVCGGAMRQRRLMTIAPATPEQTIKELEKSAVAGDLAAFRATVKSIENSAETGGTELWLFRCAVCASGAITFVPRSASQKKLPPPEREIATRIVDAYFNPDGRPAFEARVTSRPSAPP